MHLNKSGRHCGHLGDLSINARPIPLLRLLFARDAWKLGHRNGLPPLALPPESGVSQPPAHLTSVELEEQWQASWHQMWSWYGSPKDDDVKRKSRDYRQLRESSTIPRDHVGLWSNFSEEAFSSWLEEATPLNWDSPSGVNSMAYEQACSAEVRSATRYGLQRVVVLPFAGYFSEWVTPAVLVVSAQTRGDSARYGLVLSGGSGVQ